MTYFNLSSILKAPVVFLCVLLGACAQYTEMPTSPYVPLAKSTGATLFVFRDTTMPTKKNVEVQIDGAVVANLPPSRFTRVSVPAGEHTVAVGYPSFPDMRARLVVSFVEGETYVLYYDSLMGREKSFFGIRPDPVPGVTGDGQGGFTRVRLLSPAEVPRVIAQYPYVVPRP